VERDYYKSIVPGSLMLLGEHAVLHDASAIVCAVDKYLKVTLYPNPSDQIKIYSKEFTEHKLSRFNIKVAKPYEFVLAAIKLFTNQLPSGFELQIDADFTSKIGFGSSAAVTAGVVAVLCNWIDPKATKLDLFHIAKTAILNIQEIGSCADLAASIFGGVILYKKHPVSIEPLSNLPALTVQYSGYKTPTQQVIKIVEQSRAENPEIYKNIFDTMGLCVTQGAKHIKNKNWSALGEIFNTYNGLMHAIGVSDKVLSSLVEDLRCYSGIYGSKISGAGLGDCIIGLGSVIEDIKQIPVNISKQGMICE
jgi:mevalonate kinase